MKPWLETCRGAAEDIRAVLGAMPGNPINPPTYFVHTWDVQ